MKKITINFPNGEIDGHLSVMKVEVEGYDGLGTERVAHIMQDFTTAYAGFLVGMSAGNPDMAAVALHNIVVPQIEGIIEAARHGAVDMIAGAQGDGACPLTDFANGRIDANELNARLGKKESPLQDRVVAEALRKAKDIKGGKGDA